MSSNFNSLHKCTETHSTVSLSNTTTHSTNDTSLVNQLDPRKTMQKVHKNFQLTKNGDAPATEARYSNSEAVNSNTAPLVLASIQAHGIRPW